MRLDLPKSELKVIEKQSINTDIEVYTGLSPVMTDRPDTEIYHTSNQAINCGICIQRMLTQLYLMVVIYQLCCRADS